MDSGCKVQENDRKRKVSGHSRRIGLSSGGCMEYLWCKSSTGVKGSSRGAADGVCYEEVELGVASR